MVTPGGKLDVQRFAEGVIHRLTAGEGKSFKTHLGQMNALNQAFNVFTASGQVAAAIGIPLLKWLKEKQNDTIRAEIKAAIEQFGADGPFASAFAQSIRPTFSHMSTN